MLLQKKQAIWEHILTLKGDFKRKLIWYNNFKKYNIFHTSYIILCDNTTKIIMMMMKTMIMMIKTVLITLAGKEAQGINAILGTTINIIIIHK